MPVFSEDGVDLAFLDEGEGPPLLLLHGFASNAQVNWVYPGWVDLLTKAGRRVIAPDHRGHGASAKLYAKDSYGLPLMAEDARRLLDHLGIEKSDVLGYSMGARIGAFLGIAHPARVRTLILGGMGDNLLTGLTQGAEIAQALEAGSLAEVSDPTGRAFRQFAEQTGSDLAALAACMRGTRQQIAPEDLQRLTMPVLVAVGTRDLIAGSAEALAARLPHAEVLAIPGRDHMLSVGDKVFKQGALAFLARHG